MTDNTDTPSAPDPAPIVVKASAAPAAWSRVAQGAITLAAGFLLSKLIPSESLMVLVGGPVVAAVAGFSGAIAAGAWSIWQTIISHRQKVALAEAAPNGVVTP